MDPREANRRTLAVYEAQFEQYLADLPSAPNADLLALYGRLAAAVPSGSVLEIGSGPGRCAIELEQRGLTVHRTDATVAFVARLQGLGVDAEVLDVLTDELGGPYDALFANAVLPHFARDDLAALLRRATDSARWLAFTVKEGDGDRWTTRKLDQPRWFVYWREPELRTLLADTGWQVEWLSHSNGRYDDWLTVLASRA